MKRLTSRIAMATLVGLAFGVSGIGTAGAVDKGGTLNFVVAGEAPSKDAHRETTYAVIHPYAPFYSLLIRVNPKNPQSPTDLVCDLCKGKGAKVTDGSKTYTFRIREGVKFHDGTPLTAHDVVATFKKIIFPPEGVPSARKTFFKMVESVSAPDDYTVVFKLKFPSGAFLPAVAAPYNWVYSKKDLDTHGYNWHTNHVNGSGPFMFIQHQPGAFVEGKKNPNYHHKGQPYLDGFKAIIAKKMSVRIQSIRGNRAAIEFRGFPPKARDDLVAALGDKIKVQESDWNCELQATPNHTRKPFDDARVRRALTLGIDRWGGSAYLSRIAIVKTVGGVVFPGHPFAADKQELQQVAGYWSDIEKSRAEAKKLLAEAGASNLSVDYNNRDVDQPYKTVSTWLIDQWAKIGVNTKQTVRPTPQFYATLRKSHEYDVSIDFNCQSIVNPIADVSKFVCSAGNNYSQCKDDKLEQMYNNLLRAASAKDQRAIIRQYERRALDEQAHAFITLWWYKINPHRSYVKGWKIAPSHYLNQQLDNVWLDKKLLGG
jgi:peptide/nickel transport system substrate-binding protein